MDLLVISDVHYMPGTLKKILEKEQVDMILYTGDGLDNALPVLKEQDTPFEYVVGNVDMQDKNRITKVLTINNKKIIMTHGHYYNVKMDLNRYEYAALEVNADLALYGHTHMEEVHQVENCIMVNPGAVMFGHYAIVHLDDEITVELKTK